MLGDFYSEVINSRISINFYAKSRGKLCAYKIKEHPYQDLHNSIRDPQVWKFSISFVFLFSRETPTDVNEIPINFEPLEGQFGSISMGFLSQTTN